MCLCFVCVRASVCVLIMRVCVQATECTLAGSSGVLGVKRRERVHDAHISELKRENRNHIPQTVA